MEQFVSSRACKIIVADGKQNVRDVLHVLENANFAGVLGMVDADFDRVEGNETLGPNIITPEYHDLETMLICSPALWRVLGELGSPRKLEALRGDVLDELILRALPMAYLRLYALRNSLKLKFKGVKHSAWINAASFEVDVGSLIERVRNHSQRFDVPAGLLASGMDEVRNENLEPREMCNGGDLIEILSVGLRRVLGANNASSVTGKELRRYLRLAYSGEDFAASGLCKDIRRWEAENGDFRFLET